MEYANGQAIRVEIDVLQRPRCLQIACRCLIPVAGGIASPHAIRSPRLIMATLVATTLVGAMRRPGMSSHDAGNYPKSGWPKLNVSEYFTYTVATWELREIGRAHV